MQKAEEYTVQLGDSSFKATDGWFTCFKKHEDLVFKKLNGEAADADHKSSQIWLEKTRPKLREEYQPEEIFNRGETGLFY